jgi:hypothetical protein
MSVFSSIRGDEAHSRFERAWRHASVAVVLAVASCARASPTVTPTRSASEPAAPRPPGVAVDPTPRLPSPTRDASTDEGVAVLQAPTDSAAAFDVLRRFFRAVAEESTSDLDAVLADDARVTLTGGGRLPARNSWRARLARLDYRTLENQPVYRESQVETYRMVGNVTPRSRTGSLPLDVAGEDLLLRVPIVATRAGSTRLFGDEMWFLLKPGPNGYRIAELVENFQLP